MMDKREESIAGEGQDQRGEFYRTCSGRISQPLQCLIEMADAVMNEAYLQNFHHDDNNIMREAIECNFMRKALLFQKAVKKTAQRCHRSIKRGGDESG